jgi:hypothetical protein
MGRPETALTGGDEMQTELKVAHERVLVKVEGQTLQMWSVESDAYAGAGLALVRNKDDANLFAAAHGLLRALRVLSDFAVSQGAVNIANVASEAIARAEGR